MPINRKTYLKFAAAFLFLAAVLLLAPLLFVLLYQDHIKEAVKSSFAEASDQVLSDFSVSLSVLQHFPYATFTFRNISIHDTSRHRRKEVFRAGKVKLKADLTSLLRKKVVIRGLIIEKSSLYHGVDAAGNQTTLRFRQNAGSGRKDFSVQIPEITIRDMKLKAENQFKRTGLGLIIKDARLELNTREGVLSARGPLTGTVGHIRSRKLVLFRNKPFTAEVGYTYRTESRTGTLDSIIIRMPGSHLLVTGHHTRLPDRKGDAVDITCTGHLPTTEVLRGLLSAKVQAWFDSTDIRSRTHFQLRLSGEMTPTVRPRNQVAFRVADSRVSWPGTGAQLRDVTIAGRFDNGEGHSPLTSSVILHNVSASTGKGRVQGRFSLVNFKYPSIEGSLSGNVNLQEWATILRLPEASSFGGEARLKMKVKGPVHRLKKEYRHDQLEWEGDMQLHKAAFRPQRLSATFTDLTGTLSLSGKLLHLQNLTGKLGGYPVQADGNVQDLLPFFFGLGEMVTLNADIRSEGLDTRWLTASDTATKKEDSFLIPAFLRVQSQIRCSRILLPDDTLHNLTMRLHSDREKIQISDLACNAFDGTVAGAVSMPNNRNRLSDAQVTLTARLKQFDLRKPLFPGSSKSPGAAAGSAPVDFKDILFSDQSRISLFISSVILPGEENLKDLSVHMEKKNQRIELTSLQCGTTSGGKINGGGEAFYRDGKLLHTKLSLAFAYERLNLQKLIGLFTVISQQKKDLKAQAGAVAASGKNKAPSDYQIDLSVTAGQLFYEALTGNQFYLKGALHDDEVQLQYVSMQAFGGKFISRGNLNLKHGESGYPLQLHSQLQDMDLKQVFGAVDMLGLDVLNSRNVRGRVNCSVFVRTALDKTFLPGMDRTIMYTQASLRNMELIEVEAIEKALHFLREKKTSHLYFEDVVLKFVLHNNRFILPGSSLNSNLSHLYFAGTYEMEKEADLHFDIAVLDVLFGNNKRRVEKLQTNQELPKPRMVKHLTLRRDKGQYKLRLYNKQENAEAKKQMEDAFLRAVDKQRIDTTFNALPALTGRF